MKREDGVSHPDAAKLIEEATQRSAGGAVDWHVRQCSDCAREVERWREVAAAYVWRDSDPATDNDGARQGCLDDLAVAALAEGGDLGPAHAVAVEHLAACSRCRSAVAAATRALGSAAVREEVERLDRPPRPRWLRSAAPLAAAAVLVALLLRGPAAVGPELHRAPATVPGPAPLTIAPDGLTTAVQVLRWHAVDGADRYQVTLFDERGDVLWETSLTDTVAGLPRDVALQPGRDYFWFVSARTGFDRWETSDLVEFSVTAANTR
jgi:hypothetical protein